jgi:hypothetical protein
METSSDAPVYMIATIFGAGLHEYYLTKVQVTSSIISLVADFGRRAVPENVNSGHQIPVVTIIDT